MTAVSGGNFMQFSKCCSRKPAGVSTWSGGGRRTSGRDRAHLKYRFVFDGLRLISLDQHVLANCIHERSNSSFDERNRRGKVTCQVGKVKVSFRLDHQVEFGEHHALLGSTESTGAWQSKVMMRWTDSGWVVDLEMDPGEKFEFKYVTVTRHGHIVWEEGGNRIIVVPSEYEDGIHYEVVSYWDSTYHETKLELVSQTLDPRDEVPADAVVKKMLKEIPDEKSVEVVPDKESDVILQEMFEATAEGKSSDVTDEEPEEVPEVVSDAIPEAKLPIALGEKPEVTPQEMSNATPEGQLLQVSEERPEVNPEETSNATPVGKLGQSEDNENGSAPLEKKGDITCSPSVNKRDTSGLDEPAKHIVEGDQKSANWWRKLDVVRSLVTGDLVKNDRLKSLIYASIYLKWINSGQIPCHDEGGGHYLPNKCAEISRRIFRELERILSAKDVSPQEVLVVRKLQPFLPACKAPLTRLQDTAYGNHTPQDVKILPTDQNKLHCNPGLKDLAASKAMVKQISETSGEYSADFEQELKTFYAELKDFFNASSLTEQLEGLRDSFDDQMLSVLECFLKSMKNLDNIKMRTPVEELELIAGTIRNLAALRILLSKGLESGIRNDAPDDAIAMRQKWRLSDIGLEDYSFVLLSRYMNSLESAGASSWLIKEAKSANVGTWYQPLCVLGLVIQQIGVSGWQPKECLAIENELSAWQSAGIVESEGLDEDIKLWARRLNATLMRIQHLAETYTDTLLELFPVCAEVLGNAFDIPEKSVTKFTEEIQPCLTSQLSKLVLLLVKASLNVIGSEGWDTLVPGQAIGILEGREVSVTLNDEEKVAKLRPLSGRMVRLDASATGALISLHDISNQREELVAVASKDKSQVAEEGDGSSRIGSQAMSLSKLGSSKVKKTATPLTALDFSIVDVQQAGSKTAGCRELEQLANISKRVISEQGVPAIFKVPKSLVIPFGAMEEALEASGLCQEFQHLLDEIQTTQVEGGLLSLASKKLQELVSGLRPAEWVIDSIASNFSPSTRLIVRSSVNVEDLAGLYNSTPNVSLSDVQAFCRAVAMLWGSLYSEKAVLSRRIHGICQGEVAMAILVQELLAPDLSFVLHTTIPQHCDTNIVLAELAPGLGETLVSGRRGSPWCVAANKFNGKVETLAFANFSVELVQSGNVADGKVIQQVVDYSTKAMSVDPDFRTRIGHRLATIGCFVEQKFGSSQDIQGCIVGEDIYLIQSHPSYVHMVLNQC